MSIKVMTAVWDHSTHKGSELLLLLALADFAHDDGSGIYPSLRTMGQKIRMSERNVRYTLRKLEESGELVAIGKHRSGTVEYAVAMGRLRGAIFAGGQSLPRQDHASGGAKSAQEGGQPTAPDPSLIHPEPSEAVHSLDHLKRAVRPTGLGRR